MNLSKNLLFANKEKQFDSVLDTTSIKGTYHTTQFVIRLRDDIRKALDSDNEFEKIQASSTNLHENIHWWQHIGSNFGFIFSLAYPSFANISYGDLKDFAAKNCAYKPLLKYEKEYYKKNGVLDLAGLNRIANNYYDIEYAKLFALDNKNINHILDDRRFFLHMGHCYHILWSTPINMLASAVDNEYNYLPNIDKWVEQFNELTKSKIEGFYIDSSIRISPIGIQAIYEGQAIFNQIQYLTVTLNRHYTIEDFESLGMLHGIYCEAFDLFLKITKLKRPTNPLDSIIGLFLLVCDLSINPNNGFPLDVYDFENFINKNDPGIRFVNLCASISNKTEKYLEKIVDYSKQEYINICKELSESIGCKCSYESINSVISWSKSEAISNLLKEEKELNFSAEFFFFRLMFSKYIRFQEDKQKHPNIFCWFGFHSASNNKIEFEIVDSLFKKHHALFIDDFDNEIKPVIFEQYMEENIKNTFNKFYQHNIQYDLTVKWVAQEGKFTFDYEWLANERAANFVSNIKRSFKKQYGISCDDISVI